MYKKAYELAMEIFKHSKTFPPEERYALMDSCEGLHVRYDQSSGCMGKTQIRRSLCEQATDCDGENSETDTSLDFVKDCQYITEQQHKECVSLCTEIGKMLGSMLNNPSKFLLTVDR